MTDRILPQEHPATLMRRERNIEDRVPKHCPACLHLMHQPPTSRFYECDCGCIGATQQAINAAMR